MTSSVKITESRDREGLAEFFRREESAHAYALADLDRPFWPGVRAFIATRGGEIAAAALLLESLGVPLLYAVAPPGDELTRVLLEAIAEEIPKPCAANLAAGVARDLGWSFASAGEFLKMRLRGEVPQANYLPLSHVEALGPADLRELQAFLERSAYGAEEGGFFRPYMLELGPYFAIRREGEIVAMGGVHVLSERFGVAALGNIVTAPAFRGRGYAGAITRALCRALVARVPLIALNVRCDNLPAIRCYTRVGFEPVLRYEEGWIEAVA